MGNPYDVEFEVPEGSPRIEFPAYSCCYFYPGDIIRMSEAEFSTCRKTLMPEPPKDCCFPAYGCPAEEEFRVPVLVGPGETFEQPVSLLEGCSPPRKVCFHYCAGCLYVGYDAPPVIDPTDPAAAAGEGADPNPDCRSLVTDDGCVETLHIHNPSDAAVIVTLMYFC